MAHSLWFNKKNVFCTYIDYSKNYFRFKLILIYRWLVNLLLVDKLQKIIFSLKNLQTYAL